MTAPRLLVVEDEAIVRLDLQARLEEFGYQVRSVASGEEAVKVLESGPVDVVLMDIHLEQAMDGVVTAAMIKDRFQVPIVYLTAHADEATLQRAQLTEPHGYILKPFQNRDLRMTIEVALQRHGMEERLAEVRRWLSAALKSVGDGLIATDWDGKIVFMNPMAEELTGWGESEAVGRSLDEVYRLIHEATRQAASNPLHSVRTKSTHHSEGDRLLVGRGGRETPVVENAQPIVDVRGEVSGVVVAFQDVTGLKKREKELKDALASVKRLSGLLPICANCKKIRDDKGYWTQVEQYVHERSEANFSHGICPPCLKALYPGLADRRSGDPG